MEGIRRNDRFVAYAKSNISATDYQILTIFYQPIIGMGAYTLYCTLINLLDRQSLVSEDYLHGDLESLLNMKLAAIEKDRFRLEAIGLMDTYYFDDHFAYELKMPMSAQSFVNDGVLGQYLIASVTKDRFKKLVQIFKLKTPNVKKYIKTSKQFDEVFLAIHLNEPELEESLKASPRPNGIKTGHTTFDWRLFIESIPVDFLDLRQLTDAVKEKILNLHYVYGLDEIQMHDVFLKSIDSDKNININKLAVNAREEFKLTHIAKKQPEIEVVPRERNLPTDPVGYFKAVSPMSLLEEMGGGKASAADLRIVERLLEEVKIDKGVLNVLLAYVARIKDGTLPGYEYFEKVALDWKRNQVETVENAIEYVQHLSAKYERSKDTKTGKRVYKGAKSTRPDVEISWLDDYIKSIE